MRRNIGEILANVAIVLILAAMAAYGSRYLTADAACLRHGWPDSRITWDFGTYCVRMDAMTSVSVPLSEVAP